MVIEMGAIYDCYLSHEWVVVNGRGSMESLAGW